MYISLWLFLWLMDIGDDVTATVTCVQEFDCITGRCFRHVECVFGDCFGQDGCLCNTCYKGSTCDKYVHDFTPKFAVPSATIEVKGFSDLNTIYLIDLIERTECKNDSICPCLAVNFFFHRDPEPLLHLSLNENTGELQFLERPELDDGTYEEEIAAVTEPGTQLLVATMTLKIIIAFGAENVVVKVPEGLANNDWNPNVDEQGLYKIFEDTLLRIAGYDGEEDTLAKKRGYDGGEVLSRQKREVNNTLPVGSVQFRVPVESSNDTAYMSLGHSQVMDIQIIFPPSDTVDMTIEVFIMGNDTFALALGEVKILSVGSCLSMAAGDMVEINDAVVRTKVNTSAYYESALIEFGTVTNDAACVNSNNLTDVSLTLRYDVLMVQPYFQQHNDTPVSVICGCDYANKTKVWIAADTYSVVYFNDTYTTSEATGLEFDVVAPDSIPIGQSSVITLNVYIPDLFYDLKVHLFVPLNMTLSDWLYADALSVCDAAITHVGKNYRFMDLDSSTITRYSSDSNLTVEQLIVEYTDIINAGKNSNSNGTVPDDLLALKFLLDISDDADLVGKNVSIGATVHFGQHMFVIEIALRISAPLPDQPTIHSPSISSFLSSDTVAPYEILIHSINMEVPADTNYHYIVQSLTSLDPSHQYPLKLKVCGLNVIEHGENIPCRVTKRAVNKIYRYDSNYADQLQQDIGTVLNSGFRKSDGANTLRLDLYYSMIDDYIPVVSDEDNATGIFTGLKIGEDSIWVSQKNVSIRANSSEDASYKSDIPADKLPVIKLLRRVNTVTVGEEFKLTLDMHVYPGLKMNDIQLEAGSMNSLNISFLEITGMSIIGVGDHLPCLSDNDIQRKLNITKSSGSEINNRVSTHVASVQNIGSSSVLPFSEDPNNLVNFEVNFVVTSHPDFVNASEAFPYIGVSISSNQIWVGGTTLTVYARVEVPPIVIFSNHSTIAAGQLLEFYVILKPLSLELSEYSVTLSGIPDTVHVCAVRISRVGSHLLSGLSSVTTEISGDKLLSNIIFSSYGSGNLLDASDSKEFDNSSIEITFYLQDKIPVAHDDYTVELSTRYNDDITRYDVNISTTAPASAYSPQGIISYQMERVRVETDEVSYSPEYMRGETVRLRLTLQFDRTYALYRADNLLVHFEVPSEDLWYLLSMKLTDYDKEAFPCLIPDMIETDATSVDVPEGETMLNLTTELVVHLGVVCLVPPINTTKQIFEITLEGYASMRRLSTGALSSNISSFVKGESALIVAADLQLLQVTKPDEYDGLTNVSLVSVDVVSEVGPNSGIVNINEDFYVDIAVSIPLNSTVYLQITLDQAEISFQFADHLTVVAIGSDILGVYKQDINLETVKYSPGTRQAQQSVVEFGAVTAFDAHSNLNNGSSITFRLSARLLDSQSALDYSQHTISAIFTYNSGQTSVEEVITVTAVRQGTERPSLRVTAVPSCEIALTNRDMFNITYNIKHTENSTAIATNVKVATMLPPFLKFKRIAKMESHDMSSLDTLSVVKNNHSVEFIISELTMYEQVEVKVEVEIVPFLNKSFTSRSIYIPWKAIYDSYRWSGNPYSGSSDPMDYVTCTASLTDPNSLLSCVAAQALGMSTNIIHSAQLTAAPLASGSSIEDLRPPRLMTFGTRKPYAHYHPHRFVEVDLLALHYIQHIVITSNPSSFEAIIYTSKDGVAWNTFGTTPATYGSGQSIQVNKLGSHVRIIFPSPSSLDVNIEIYGCVKQSSYRAVKPKMKEYKDAPRQLMASSTDLYLCDSKPEAQFPSTCHVKCLKDNVWQAMDERIQNLVGINNQLGYTFAISKSGKYMMTRNGGKMWANISPKYFQSFSMDEQPMSLPWMDLSQDVSSTPYTYTSTNGAHTFAAIDNGIHQIVDGSWKRIVDWQTCC